jgi:hypothetical protein
MNRRTGGVQFAAERVVIGILGVIGFGMGIRRRAHILKIAPVQGRLISWQRSRGFGRFAGREDKGANHRERGGKKISDFRGSQLGSPELLTVIHNPLQGLFRKNFWPRIHTDQDSLNRSPLYL